MSADTSNSMIKELEMIPLESQKEVEKQYMDYFSFGKYLELHQRVEYLENELDLKGVVEKRATIHNRKYLNDELQNGDEVYVGGGGDNDESAEDFKSCHNQRVMTEQQQIVFDDNEKQVLLINRSDDININ